MTTADSPLVFLGRYRVLHKLGGGAAGTVYLCSDAESGQKYALKVLSMALIEQDSTALTRFLREARAASALLHPNIIRTYHIEQSSGRYFLVMEYIDGLTLEDLVLKHGQLPVDAAVCYIYQALLGLEYIHQAGMVHRDLKPTNLMVDHSGNLRILDLGLVTFTDDRRDKLTEQFPRILGTLDFMSPEQAERSHNVDIRADIYSMGATLYFLLTGQTPFLGGNIASKLIAMQFHAPKSPREYRSDIDESLVQVLFQMLAKAPANRYETPLDAAQALSVWMQHEKYPPGAFLQKKAHDAASQALVQTPANRAAPSSFKEIAAAAAPAAETKVEIGKPFPQKMPTLPAALPRRTDAARAEAPRPAPSGIRPKPATAESRENPFLPTQGMSGSAAMPALPAAPGSRNGLWVAGNVPPQSGTALTATVPTPAAFPRSKVRRPEPKGGSTIWIQVVLGTIAAITAIVLSEMYLRH